MEEKGRNSYGELSFVECRANLSRENIDDLRIVVLNEHMTTVRLEGRSNHLHPLNGWSWITVELTFHDR